MAEKNYYTYKESPINGDILMNVEVFDVIIRQAFKDEDSVFIDESKGFNMPGSKRKVSCKIEDNIVSISVHVNVKYGINISKKMKELQNKISNSIKQLTNVNVKTIDLIVENIEF